MINRLPLELLFWFLFCSTILWVQATVATLKCGEMDKYSVNYAHRKFDSELTGISFSGIIVHLKSSFTFYFTVVARALCTAAVSQQSRLCCIA